MLLYWQSGLRRWDMTGIAKTKGDHTARSGFEMKVYIRVFLKIPFPYPKKDPPPSHQQTHAHKRANHRYLREVWLLPG
jgi:hypothetical protein